MSEQYTVPLHANNTNHPGFSWGQALAFLHNCYQVGQDGESPEERAWGQKYKSAIIHSGTQCSLNIRVMDQQ
eukprot:5742543-Amphidinium_carterae.1